ncbi:hypothetical protein [Marinilactibacillus sp. Marseille-P9653]|uniref:hypothetical protein n=1 Tax=Marinilactibacillus sp. Marseille-P9653 TaxID=2866583 RepID=UPI001CE4ACAE|nr:hypothetical protein [Marinilactibacillus sp. Marseille-P9653]
MDILIWLVQLVIFFSIVSGVLNSLSKKANKNQSSNRRNVFNEPTQTSTRRSTTQAAPKQNRQATPQRSTQQQTVNQRRSARDKTVQDASTARGAARDITTERERRRKDREKLDQARQERTNKLRNQSSNTMTEVKSLKTKSISKSNETAEFGFTEDNIVRAFAYKEILDKPIALRDE